GMIVEPPSGAVAVDVVRTAAVLPALDAVLQHQAEVGIVDVELGFDRGQRAPQRANRVRADIDPAVAPVVLVNAANRGRCARRLVGVQGPTAGHRPVRNGARENASSRCGVAPFAGGGRRRTTPQARDTPRVAETASPIGALFECYGPDEPWAFADPCGWKCSP